MSFLDYWTIEHGIRVDGKDVFAPYRALAMHSGPRMMHERFAMICDRPRTLKIDDANRPHCDDGPSHEWSDGWRLWYSHGVKADRQIILSPHTQTSEQISGERNAEAKRIRIERFGWERYLETIQATGIDFRVNDIEGTREVLYRADDLTVLVCICPSTGKLFSLECPPATKTCAEAQRYLSSGLCSRIISAA